MICGVTPTYGWLSGWTFWHFLTFYLNHLSPLQGYFFGKSSLFLFRFCCLTAWRTHQAFCGMLLQLFGFRSKICVWEILVTEWGVWAGFHYICYSSLVGTFCSISLGGSDCWIKVSLMPKKSHKEKVVNTEKSQGILFDRSVGTLNMKRVKMFAVSHSLVRGSYQMEIDMWKF